MVDGSIKINCSLGRCLYFYIFEKIHWSKQKLVDIFYDKVEGIRLTVQHSVLLGQFHTRDKHLKTLCVLEGIEIGFIGFCFTQID